MQYVGDAVMAVFGAPVATTDHPDRSLAAALAMHLRQDSVNAEWMAEGRTPFGLGIGVVTGTVAAALLGSEERVEYTLVGENKVTFFIADVSGHGASSAFVTALLKNFTAHLRSDFRNHGREHIIRPKRFLEKVSYDMLRTGIGKHMTMCIGVLDMSTNRLSYSVAGHLPQPVLISPGQKPRYLEGKGMPAGMFENPVFEEREIALPDTFTLLMFSDGILEILPPTELVDKEQLLLKLLESCPCKLEDLADCLGLNEASDAPDDIAILMLTKE